MLSSQEMGSIVYDIIAVELGLCLDGYSGEVFSFGYKQHKALSTTL